MYPTLKEHFDYDLLLGSDDDQRFTNAYLIEMLMEETDGYQGQAFWVSLVYKLKKQSHL